LKSFFKVDRCVFKSHVYKPKSVTISFNYLNKTKQAFSSLELIKAKIAG